MYLSVKSNYFEIINWLMSCRVFNKTIEQAIINSVIKLMLKSKKLDLITSYIPTKKNHLLLDILKKLGFEKDKEYSNRTSDWKLKYKKVKQHACLVKNEI